MTKNRRVRVLSTEEKLSPSPEPTARQATVPVTDAEAPELSPLYGVALLKMALELKKSPERTLDEVLSGVLRSMRLDEQQLRQYLTRHGGLLQAARKSKVVRKLKRLPHPMD